jgi:hypothetical protein
MISKASLRTFIYYSTLLGVFSALFFIKVPFALRLFDAIMLVNLPLMLFFINFARVPMWVLGSILYLALNGGIGILNGTDTAPLFAKEFLGISISLLYFYYFFKFIHNDFERAFSTYARIACWFTIIAFPLWAAACLQAHGYERLRGLTLEPAAFCALVLPAYYWYAYLYFTARKHAVEVIVFTLAVALSGSSLGYIGVVFGVMLLLSGRKKHLLAVPIVVSGLLSLTYAVSPYFRLRVDDTLLAAVSGDVAGSNLSTYALISNLFVTQQVFKESPLIGNGLGSHPVSHARFIRDVPGAEAFLEGGTGTYNAPDAASLSLRSLSELGIVGLTAILIFLFHFHVGGRGVNAAISNAILVCFVLKLMRVAVYFPPEQFFLAFIYKLNHQKFQCEVRLAGRRHSLKRSIGPALHEPFGLGSAPSP